MAGTESGAVDVRRLTIPSYDGTGIGANVYIPRASSFPGPRPTLILINSWFWNQFEYEVKARTLASEGYVVMSYASRGFQFSQGYVEVGGPQDSADASAMIDWLLANTSSDPANIGAGGISYGAGIAILAAEKDPRIKVVLSMSGWGDLRQAMFAQDTLPQVWIDILLALGKLTGQLDPDAAQQMANLQSHTNMAATLAWADTRSPVSYAKNLQGRQVAMFLANSFEDDLFPPSRMLSFYQAINGPKMFYLDHGIHASSALPALVDLPDAVWDEAMKWSDHYLRGAPLATQPPISFPGPNGREYYAAFPGDDPTNLAAPTLTPLNSLSASPSPSTSSQLAILFTGGVDSGASTGIPVVSQLASALGAPVHTNLNSIDQTHAAVYVGLPLATTMRLRGGPVLTVPLSGYSTPAQLVAYLYDVDATNLGTLITYGAVSHYAANVSPSLDAITLKIMSYDIPAGHRLGVAIDTVDALYKKITTGLYPVSIDHFPGRITTLTVPVASS